MAERQSVLEGQLHAAGRDGIGGQRSLRLAELRGWELCQIAGSARTDDALRAQLQALGLPCLPRESGRVVCAGEARFYRLSPARYLWLAPTDTLMQRTAQELDPATGSVTMLSSARVRLALEGPQARDVLARGIALDLHPAVFAVGHVAQTGLHHVPLLLERVGEQCFELQVPTTWAVSVWEWLRDAALPFGYDIVVESPSTAVAG
jgi:methylglutamate dehydrogenase subunit D